LLALEAGGDNIYYVAPRFYSAAEFDAHFRSNRVHDCSAWFRPSQITPPNYVAPHTVVYDDSGVLWEVRSEAEKTQQGDNSFADFLRVWQAKRSNLPKVAFEKFVEGLAVRLDKAIAVARKQSNIAEIQRTSGDTIQEEGAQGEAPTTRSKDQKRQRDLSLLESVALKARTELGLEMVLASIPALPAKTKA
jgi:hypothetical protein